MTQPFRDFAAMVVETHKGQDWDLIIKDPSAAAVIIAIHGGEIEPLTSELATTIAGDDLNLYDLRGIRASNNAQLRIPMIRYQEMRLDFLLRNCRAALHIEGSPDEGQALVIGGANVRLVQDLGQALATAGFELGEPVSAPLLSSPRRFYNHCPLGGAQIEVPQGLRAQMVGCSLADPSYREVAQRTALFTTFCATVRETLQAHLEIMRSDLSATMAQFEQSTDQFPASLRSQAQHDHD